MADQKNQADQKQEKPEKKTGANQKSGSVDQEVQEEAAEERKEGGYQ